MRFSPEIIDRVIAFHGHTCPGLAIGIRVAELALERLGEPESGNMVAVTETDMCGVDAIQFLTGCTFGKGNLIHKDYGKMAFTFYDRRSGKGFRARLRREVQGNIPHDIGSLVKKGADGSLNTEEKEHCERLRERARRHYMTAPLAELFDVSPAPYPAPRRARILDSLVCERCGEVTMESRTRRFAGRTLCIPCFESVEQKV